MNEQIIYEEICSQGEYLWVFMGRSLFNWFIALLFETSLKVRVHALVNFLSLSIDCPETSKVRTVRTPILLFLSARFFYEHR